MVLICQPTCWQYAWPQSIINDTMKLGISGTPVSRGGELGNDLSRVGWVCELRVLRRRMYTKWTFLIMQGCVTFSNNLIFWHYWGSNSGKHSITWGILPAWSCGNTAIWERCDSECCVQSEYELITLGRFGVIRIRVSPCCLGPGSRIGETSRVEQVAILSPLCGHFSP
jgi:hypothetical protein